MLVADLIEHKHGTDGIEHKRDLERTDRATLTSLMTAFDELDLRCHHYVSPDELARNADRHAADVVLSIFGGQGSRNRMGLVPAICESFGLNYIGPDIYGRILAQDKELSKRLASEAELRTPVWRIARSAEDLIHALDLQMPVVLKPLMEGSSIGITQANLARSREDAMAVGRRLLQAFAQPIIIEAFVAGKEVALTRIEGDDDAWAFSEVTIEGDPDFFEGRLFDAAEKLQRHPMRTVKTIDASLSSEDRAAMERFLHLFGHYGYCRIDGRLKDGHFHFIEFTPDAWLGEAGQFAASFVNKGWTYARVIEAVLASAGSDPRCR